MARDYARIMTAIWDNKGFLSLGEPEQRAYLLLVTQPDISAAGVLSLRVRRWANMSSTSDPDGMARSLKALEGARFVVIDHDAEELLIRSFIRWDAGFNNPKRKPVIVRAREEARSELIREHLDVEFRRCGLLPEPPPPNGGQDAPQSDRDGDTAPDSQRDSLSGPVKANPGKDPFPQVECLSHPNAPEDGVVVAYPHSSTPQSTPPQTSDADASDADASRRADLVLLNSPTISAQDCTAAWVDEFRHSGLEPTTSQKGQAARDCSQLMKNNPPELVMQLARAAGRKCRPAVANEMASQIAAQQNRPSRPSTTDKIGQLQAMKTGTDNRPTPNLPRGEFR